MVIGLIEAAGTMIPALMIAPGVPGVEVVDPPAGLVVVLDAFELPHAAEDAAEQRQGHPDYGAPAKEVTPAEVPCKKLVNYMVLELSSPLAETIQALVVDFH